MILSLDSIVLYLKDFGIIINTVYMSEFECAVIMIIGNILWLFVIFFSAWLVWKVLSRVISCLF